MDGRRDGKAPHMNLDDDTPIYIIYAKPVTQTEIDEHKREWMQHQLYETVERAEYRRSRNMKWWEPIEYPLWNEL